MSHLMNILYSVLDSRQQEGEAQAVKAASEAVRAAEQRLTSEEFDDLWNAILDIDRASELDSFTLGFRLGVQLTMEGLKPIS